MEFLNQVQRGSNLLCRSWTLNWTWGLVQLLVWTLTRTWVQFREVQGQPLVQNLTMASLEWMSWKWRWHWLQSQSHCCQKYSGAGVVLRIKQCTEVNVCTADTSSRSQVELNLGFMGLIVPQARRILCDMNVCSVRRPLGCSTIKPYIQHNALHKFKLWDKPVVN
jgi:hypothetical protein